jgi:anaerobic selenocysteine-containing dehydrogenase
MSDSLSLSRRGFLNSAGAVAASTAVGPVQANWLPDDANLGRMKAEGFEQDFVICAMCGANCGLTAMKRDSAQGREIYLLANTEHPQRGVCGRGASTLYLWNHPLRLKTPLKRVGARGEGKLEPVSWDQALDEIAARLKANVAAQGERSVVLTTHELGPACQLAAWALGTPNVINHAATCSTPGQVARRMTFESPFDNQSRVDPDYDNVRYLLLVGRTLNASIGAAARLARARRNHNAKVVFVDPRQPDNALAGAEWVPILPGTDAAFLLALVREIIATGKADLAFLTAHTNGPMLIRGDGLPLTQADVTGNNAAQLFAVMNSATKRLAYQGVKRDPQGVATGFIADQAVKPTLDHAGTVRLASGATVAVKSAFRLLKERVDQYTPERAAEITGIPADTIRRIAHDFVAERGVADDGWYLTRNANDTDVGRALLILDAVVGNIDRKGGLAFSPGASVSRARLAGDGTVTTPFGQFKLADTKRLDTYDYSESTGAFHAVIEAILSGRPYPVTTVFAVGTTLVQREANVPRLLEAIRQLDLFVVLDVMPQEITDYADYVLPASFFVEREEIDGVSWAVDGNLHRSGAVLPAPEGVDARDDQWILLEILRRAYPERAAQVGYTAAQTDAQGWAAYAEQIRERMLDSTLSKYIRREPGVGTRVRRELKGKGFSVIEKKRFEQLPYVRPLGTASGKVELYALRAVLRAPVREAGFDPLPDYRPVTAYALPQTADEFYLVSGKSMANGSGLGAFALSGRALGDRSVWMNPADAQALGLQDGDEIELQGLDTGQKGKARLKVTRRVRPRVLFTYAFSNGHRATALRRDERFAFMEEGINPNWLSPGRAEPVTGSLANNLSVKVRKA